MASPDMHVQLGDRLFLENPLMPASGPLVGDARKIRFLAEQGVGGLVSKTISVKPAQVPRPCILAERDRVYNAELWSEYGPEKWEEEFFPGLTDLSQPLFVSLGYKEEEIVSLLPRFEKFAAAFELSTHYLGKSLEPIARTVRSASSITSKPVFIKMSPHIPDPVEFAQMVKENGGYGVVAINSLGPAYPLGTFSTNSPLGSDEGFGWVSGPVIKPIALAIIRKVATHVDIPIIGTGGIASASDVIAFLRAGASAVQMLSAAMLRGKTLYAKILSALPHEMQKHGIEKLQHIRGQALQANTQPLYERRTPRIDNDRCTRCNLCVDNCPYFALEMTSEGVSCNSDECFGCGLCQSRCPVHAISGVFE
ncbi:MAG TPA: 4Fe-4S binding protein [Thermotogota bacterium]|nr:4Fe-4S binding protein [Thermotogota bacterium]HRW91691.1 4Fe-4S binding protein [Thermotogota bacterium]